MRVYQENTIRERMDVARAYELQRQGLIAHSLGKTCSSLSHIHLGKGSFHIKSGMLEGSPDLFIKVASGFSENWRSGLPTGDGCILGFSSSTGQLDVILVDRGYLTDLRTSLAARLCVETFKPEKVEAVGVLGTGVQARLCAQQQAHITHCRNLFVWGRSAERVQGFKADMEKDNFDVTVVDHPNHLLRESDVVITTTSSREPLLGEIQERRTRLIIAVGADEAGKQELAPELVASAKLWVADDPIQSAEIGEFQTAIRLQKIRQNQVDSLGRILSGQPFSCDGLIICDLSGLPVQDAQIASTFLELQDPT